MPYSKSSVTDHGRGKNLSGFEYCNQHSTTAAEVPAAADLKPGELAVNSADAALYCKAADGTVKAIPPAATTSTAGISSFGAVDGSAAQGNDVRLRAVAGVGNLREWFERQFNCDTDATTAGKNKRVSICLFGDSLVQRMSGWFAYLASKEHDYTGQSGGFGNGGGPLHSEAGGPSAPLGVFTTTTGDVNTVTNGFSVWPSGEYFDIGPGGTYVAPFVTGSTVGLWKFAYVAEPGAATFDIEIASAVGGPWTKLGDSVNAANATQIGAVVARDSGSFTRRFVRVRNTHATSRVKVIGVYAGWATSVRGYDGLGLSAGGISPAQAAQASPAIYTPILTDLNPALIVAHFDDTIDQYESNWTQLLAMWRAGNPNRSVLVVANAARSGISDADNESLLRFLMEKVRTDNIAVIDMPSLLSSYGATLAQGWAGDGIHLDPRAYAYVALRAWTDLSIGSPASVTASERATFQQRLSVPEIRFETRPGGNLFGTGVVDDYYFRIVGDTQFIQGGRIEIARDLWFSNKGGSIQIMYLTPNEAVYGNQMPDRFYRRNVSSEVIPNGYASITSGVTEWTAGNKRVMRDQASTQVLRLGPYTGEASLNFPSINANAEATLAVTVAGVTAAGKFAVSLGWSAALEDGIVVKQAWVSGADTVSIRVRNVSAAAIDPAAATAYVVAMGIA
jgi:hypothetical protein